MLPTFKMASVTGESWDHVTDAQGSSQEHWGGKLSIEY